MDYNALKHSFNKYSERKNYFVERYSDILGEDVVYGMIDLGFLRAPASTKYHGNYEGGLFDHSVNVAAILAEISLKHNIHWTTNVVVDSALRVGILHDLCKIDQYKSDPNNEGMYIWDNSPIIKGHGTKSVIYAQLLGAKLTAEEIACITYHMGAFTDSKEWGDYTNAIHKYPNVLWTHTADMIASHILEVES